MGCCPTCGQVIPLPPRRIPTRTPERTDRRCEHCGTQLKEIQFSETANAWTCLGCYLRAVEGLLKVAA